MMHDGMAGIGAVERAVRARTAEIGPFLDSNAQAFLERIYADGVAKYAARLRAHGFAGRGAVLDAGCGFGQWALALAMLGNDVAAVDTAPDRLIFLDGVVRAVPGLSVAVQRGSVTSLPFGDGVFAGVFSYSTLFLVPWREALAELARVLAPGGRLYVNANGIGWYKHLWYTAHNANQDYDPRRAAARVLDNTWRYEAGLDMQQGADILIEPEALSAELERLGFEDLRRGPEGTVFVEPPPPDCPKPFFGAEYLGDLGVYEIVATKRGGAAT